MYWYYEQAEEIDVLKIKGTWQPVLILKDILLFKLSWTRCYRRCHVKRFVLDGKIPAGKTSLQVLYEDKIIADELAQLF